MNTSIGNTNFDEINSLEIMVGFPMTLTIYFSPKLSKANNYFLIFGYSHLEQFSLRNFLP